MDLKQQLVFCKQCNKRKFSDQGIVCSLTLRKPDFIESCPDFEIDPKEAQRISNLSNDVEKEKSNNSIWVYIGIGLIVVRILLRMMRD